MKIVATNVVASRRLMATDCNADRSCEKTYQGWVVGSAENKANSAQLRLGLSLAKAKQE